MLTSLSFKQVHVALHIFIWSVLLLLPYLIGSADNNYQIGAIPGWLFTLTGIIHAAIFYGNAYFLYPKLFNKRFWWLYIVGSLLLIFVSLRLKHWLLLNFFAEIPRSPLVYRFLFAPSILVFVISFVYRMVLNRIRAERLQKERLAVQLQAELKFLRTQISPHFLFNVLTNMVSLARKKSDKLEESLIMLSGIMRYMLYDTEGKKVALIKEIEYLENYIQLQALRFGQEVRIISQLSRPAEDKQYVIEPMLLIPFVENAFKHGVTHLEAPQIHISLTVQDDVLFFEVRNHYQSQHKTVHERSSGIGLENTKQRLELLYKEKYALKTNADNNLFCIQLTLKLI